MEEAKQILERLDAGNIFDLRGVVAVVTGGGTVGEAFDLWKARMTLILGAF